MFDCNSAQRKKIIWIRRTGEVSRIWGGGCNLHIFAGPRGFWSIPNTKYTETQIDLGHREVVGFEHIKHHQCNSDYVKATVSRFGFAQAKIIHVWWHHNYNVTSASIVVNLFHWLLRRDWNIMLSKRHCHQNAEHIEISSRVWFCEGDEGRLVDIKSLPTNTKRKWVVPSATRLRVHQLPRKYLEMDTKLSDGQTILLEPKSDSNSGNKVHMSRSARLAR